MWGVIIGVAASLFALVVLLPLLLSSFRVAQEYERGVVFRLGRFNGIRGPGVYMLIPLVDRSVGVDLRTITMNVPRQDAITWDNVPVEVDAVVYFHVVDPKRAVIGIQDFRSATSLMGQTALRSVVGQSQLDDILGKRDEVNARLQQVIDQATEPWGVQVSMVEVRDVQIPEGMQRAMARQAEAERERRAKLIHAEGEAQAAERLTEAARTMGAEPIQLRHLSTLVEIASEKTSTLIYPLPMELLRLFDTIGRHGLIEALTDTERTRSSSQSSQSRGEEGPAE